LKVNKRRLRLLSAKTLIIVTFQLLRYARNTCVAKNNFRFTWKWQTYSLPLQSSIYQLHQ